MKRDWLKFAKQLTEERRSFSLADVSFFSGSAKMVCSLHINQFLGIFGI